MIDPTVAWSLGFFTGLGAGLWLASRGPRNRAPFTRSPYSLSNIWLVATKEDADKFRSKIVNPLVWEDPPEPMTVEEWARRGRRPHPTGRIVDACGRTVGYIPRSQGDTPNSPPEVP